MTEGNDETTEGSDFAETVQKSDLELPASLSADDVVTDGVETCLTVDLNASIDVDTAFFANDDAKAAKPIDDKILRDKIPGFKIVAELGRGAFGVVYRALDLKLDRHVAIKLPLLQDSTLAEKYLQEARNAAKIDAVGIVPVFQVGSTHEGQPFVVQKLIEGTTLASIVREHGALPAGQAVRLVYKIACAIAEAHRAGLVHRDLKPANILIDQQGVPWVADFGLAVFEEEQAELRGEIAGTPVYMAPEQFAGRADWLDGRADIWAIGIILYELLTGKPPFDGKSFGQLKEQILNRSPRPLRQRSQDLPVELDQIFSQCCKRDVTERYSSATELAADLEQVLVTHTLPMGSTESFGSTVSAAPHARAASTLIGGSLQGRSTLHQPSREKSSFWIGLSIVGVAVAGTVGFAFIWSQMNKILPKAMQQSPTIVVSPDQDSSRPTETGDTPLRVSQDGDGSHRTIAEAIGDAAEGAKITVARGTYPESLLIEKSIHLIGEGARNGVTILGDDGPAITIQAGCEVVLTNLTLNAHGDELSTVEVIEGELRSDGCDFVTSSYDCVRVHPRASYRADDCEYRSAEHPAIVAKGAAAISITNGDFRFELPNIEIDREQPIVGIELTECGAEIRDCTFNGVSQVGKGVSARDCNSPLIVAGCTFSNLRHGIELFNCAQIQLISANVVSGCELGVYADHSHGEIRDLDTSSCKYGFVVLDHCELEVGNARFEDHTQVAVRVQNSQIEFEQCFINDNKRIGAFIDQGNKDLVFAANGCSFQRNQIGILLIAGRARLVDGLISQNDNAGISILNYDDLPSGHQRRSTTSDDPLANTETQRSVFAKHVRINGKIDAAAMLFNATGSYQLEDCPYVDVKHGNRPAIDSRFTTEIRDGLTFVKAR